MAEMLKNTLILPEKDAVLAAKLLSAAIGDLNVVLMLIFGVGEKVEQVVGWADQLCNKTRVSDTFNARRVVWIMDSAPEEVQAILKPILDGKTPVVAVLNFNDKLAGALLDIRKINPLKLELEFAKGHKV